MIGYARLNSRTLRALRRIAPAADEGLYFQPIGRVRAFLKKKKASNVYSCGGTLLDVLSPKIDYTHTTISKL